MHLLKRKSKFFCSTVYLQVRYSVSETCGGGASLVGRELYVWMGCGCWSVPPGAAAVGSRVINSAADSRRPGWALLVPGRGAAETAACTRYVSVATWWLDTQSLRA